MTFTNALARNDDSYKNTLALDENGKGIYSFNGGKIELTSAMGLFSASAVYGQSSTPVSIGWLAPNSFPGGQGYLLGVHQTGSDFITAGPDKVLTVLRDPPGSHSFSYLEKGLSFEETSAYKGSLRNEGTEDLTLGVKTYVQIITIAGVGAMTGSATSSLETETGATVGLSHSEEYTGTDTKKYTSTLTTRFETSSDPLYVWANGDDYIGYSTNLTFGTTNNITIIPRAYYDAVIYGGGDCNKEYSVTQDWAMVQKDGICVNQSFSTLFAYPQIHIEEVLIPNIEDLISAKLLLPGQYDLDSLRGLVNADTTLVFYVSNIPATDPMFSQDSTYEMIYYKSDLPIDQQTISVFDTIQYLRQSIEKWEERMADNEEAKVNAVLLQYYSF